MTQLKQTARWLVASLAMLSGALASPASDLLDQASYYLEWNYYGFAAINLTDQINQAYRQLEQVCAQDEQCPYERAEPIIKELFEALGDDHTAYVPPAQVILLEAQRAGSNTPTPRFGVSLNFQNQLGGALVLETATGSPAEKAGLQRGDVIEAVAGQRIEPTTSREAFLKTLRDAANSRSPVTFEVRRGNQRRFVEITGAVFSSATKARVSLHGSIAVIRISDFTSPAMAESVHRIISSLEPVKAILLDVRSNPGGNIGHLISVVGAFVPNFELTIASRYKNQIYRWSPNRNLAGNLLPLQRYPVASYTGPLAVLVDQGSYSAAEYTAAITQRARRGLVYGETTGGLGNTASLSFKLINKGEAQITIARTLGPDGTPFEAAITPDVTVRQNLEEFFATGIDPQLETTLRLIQERLNR